MRSSPWWCVLAIIVGCTPTPSFEPMISGSIPVPDGDPIPAPEDPPVPSTPADGWRRGLSSNRLTNNRLTNNGLVRVGNSGIEFRKEALDQNAFDRGVARAAIDVDPEATLEFLEYVVKCALPDDASIAATFTDANGDTQTRQLHGNLGLAPYWGMTDDADWQAYRGVHGGWPDGTVVGRCDVACEEWVWACLMAHVNFFGQSVAISVRGPHASLDPIDPAEAESFKIQEATFYGDWPAAIPRDNDGGVAIEIGHIAPGWQVFQGDAHLRVCAQHATERLCPFHLPGAATDMIEYPRGSFLALPSSACGSYKTAESTWGQYVPGACGDGDNGTFGPITRYFTRPLTVFLSEPIPVEPAPVE